MFLSMMRYENVNILFLARHSNLHFSHFRKQKFIIFFTLLSRFIIKDVSDVNLLFIRMYVN